MAIICQDVTVVLAFDSRELLIQWQVKVANNLGEDHQVLVQVASAPARSKISPGPAHLHIKEYKFCLASGVPPRLLGYWEISHLRKYGVVDGRFCFEGGSQCGRCEGLYVLITNQSEDIAQALKLAAEGKPVHHKRPVSRNVSESPRRSNHWRTESHLGGVESSLHQSCAELTNQPSLHSSHILYGSDNFPWMYSETRPDSSDFGDSTSSADHSNASYHEWHDGNPELYSNSTTESCSSWNMTVHKHRTYVECCNHAFKKSHQQVQIVPVHGETAPKEPMEGSPEVLSESCECCSMSHSHQLHYGSLNQKKCCNRTHMTLHDAQKNRCSCSQLSTSDLVTSDLSNYDVPRAAMHLVNRDTTKCSKEDHVQTSTSIEENYDIPRNIREKTAPSTTHHQYSNYDTPQSVPLIHNQPIVKPHCTRVIMEHEDCRLLLCPCQRILGWIPLPYCYRGYGIENTPSKFCKVQLVEDKSQPNTCQTTAISNPHKSLETIENYITETDNPSSQHVRDTIYMQQSSKKLQFINKQYNQLQLGHMEEKLSKNDCSNSAKVNYANMEFAESLEFYENARDLIKKTIAKKQPQILSVETSLSSDEKCSTTQCCSDDKKKLFCSKCGHECSYNEKDNNKIPKEANKLITQDDYTLMFPDEFSPRKKSCSGESLNHLQQDRDDHTEYLHMSPITNNTIEKKMLPNPNESYSKSENSIPCFFNSNRDELATMSCIPGKAVLCVEESSVATNSLAKKRFRFIKEENLSHHLIRRRSNSVDGSRHSDENLYQYLKFRKEKNDTKQMICNQEKNFGNFYLAQVPQLTSPFLNSLQNRDELENVSVSDGRKQSSKQKEKSKHFHDNGESNNSFQSPVLVRRSCSVPCKPGNNRDSSSSNDSGVSAESPKFQVELDQMHSREFHLQSTSSQGSCLHFSLPRKSKNSDPLQELSFQFQTNRTATDSEVSILTESKDVVKGYNSPNPTVLTHDSHSTSSATSDMSDYIETLSLSSYSSSDTPEGLRLNHSTVITLKPRSGKEYSKVDRCILGMVLPEEVVTP